MDVFVIQLNVIVANVETVMHPLSFESWEPGLLSEKASKRALEKNEWLLAGVFSNLIHPGKFHRFNGVEPLL